ncbi:MAG: porin [Paracoccaceae bacterium]|nr:porin [Paracoccaceae bacterium]
MKNLLIATTALVATAGVAVADVKVSGYARFGAVYNDGAAPGADEVNTASRLRLQFDATTETDGGLTLGVRQRFQTEENAANAGGNQARFFASAGGLTIAMGNILGVIESAPNLYLPTKSAGMGLEGNGFASLAANTYTNGGAFGWTAYQSAGSLGVNDGVEVIYSMNGIGLHAHSTDVSYGLGANYKFADYTVAVAYEEWNEGARDGDNILFASIGGKFGAFDAALSYADTEYAGLSAEKVSLRGGYTVNDALYVYGFVADEDGPVSVDTAYGLGASYALGGGASVEGGWTSNQNGDNIVSAGIFFSF